MDKRDILNSTKKELETYRGHWPQIAVKARVSYSWLVKVMEGKTQNPRITELQRLINTLDKIRLGHIHIRCKPADSGNQ